MRYSAQQLSKGLPIAAAVLLIGGLSAHADEAALSKDFINLLQNPDHQNAVIQGAQQSASWVNNKCASASFNRAAEIAIYKPAQFDDDGSPIAGAWKEVVVADGCHVKRELNVLTIVTAPKVLHTSALLPGDTKADPILQKDAVQFASTAALGAPAGCQQGYISDTKFIGTEGVADATLPPGRRRLPWQEQWTVVQCEKHSNVMVHFIPDATGTTIHANLVVPTRK